MSRLLEAAERMLTEKEKRIADLLEANNRYLEEARLARRALADRERHLGMVRKEMSGLIDRVDLLESNLVDHAATKRADTLNAAIQHALNLGDFGGMDWLNSWNEGEPRAMRELEQIQAKLNERRDTFTVPIGWCAERDDDGRATGWIINIRTKHRKIAKNAKELVNER